MLSCVLYGMMYRIYEEQTQGPRPLQPKKIPPSSCRGVCRKEMLTPLPRLTVFGGWPLLWAQTALTLIRSEHVA